MRNLAEKIASGIKRGDTSVKKMGIDHATAQRVYRLMKADKFEGALAFYVCNKLYWETIGELKIGLALWEAEHEDYPSMETLTGVIKETDKDVLFCALQGGLMEPVDKLGKKCLEVICQLYLSS